MLLHKVKSRERLEKDGRREGGGARQTEVL